MTGRAGEGSGLIDPLSAGRAAAGRAGAAAAGAEGAEGARQGRAFGGSSAGRGLRLTRSPPRALPCSLGCPCLYLRNT